MGSKNDAKLASMFANYFSRVLMKSHMGPSWGPKKTEGAVYAKFSWGKGSLGQPFLGIYPLSIQIQCVVKSCGHEVAWGDGRHCKSINESQTTFADFAVSGACPTLAPVGHRFVLIVFGLPLSCSLGQAAVELHPYMDLAQTWLPAICGFLCCLGLICISHIRSRLILAQLM